MEMTANAGTTSFKMIDPGDEKVGFDVFIGGEGNSIKMMDPGDDEVPVAEISSDGLVASMKLIDPGDDEIGFDVFVGGEGNSIKMMDPGDDENSLIEMNGGIGGEASFYMFNPQPEPPAVLMEMSSSPLTGGSLRMFNPQPEPPAEPVLEMNSTEFGANFTMAAPGAGGLRNEITDPKFEVVVDSDGGSLDIYDEIGKYTSFEPTPFMSGGGLSLMDPSTDQTNVWIGSDGRVSARKGIFGQNITSDGNYNLVVGDENIISGNNSFAGGRVAEASHDNCFVWSDYPVGPSVSPTATSGDNQFLVRSTGGVTFYSDANMNYGVYLAPDAYSWSPIIPPLSALDTRPVDGQQILTKIGQLPIKYYSHKSQENGAEHVGPLPADFNALFSPGQEDTHISVQDEAGVALAGVKALLERIEQLEARIAELEAERR
jgi:hypothetical protein